MSTAIPRTSPIEHLLNGITQVGPRQTEVRLASPWTDGPPDNTALQNLLLGDLSGSTTKFGVKGPRAASFLESQGVQLPADIYATAAYGVEGLVAKLAEQEYILETAANDPVLEQLESGLSESPAGLLRVEHQEATFLLCGRRANEVMLQVCALDMSQVHPGTLVLTRAAVTSCAILREPWPEVLAYRIWVDASLAEYLWETLSTIIG
ncbi:MAG: hypothetical protein CMJ81_11410 [Planctomycetaceae bacterium]|jgi:sarcosine oxidase subunit gamma|nr:hypothetical protein [Planctomycetaceae bacterium]